MDLEHCMHCLHLEPTHQYYTAYTGCTWSPLTSWKASRTLLRLGTGCSRPPDCRTMRTRRRLSREKGDVQNQTNEISQGIVQ
jgi:hypothetical protein